MSEPFDYELPRALASPLYWLMVPGHYTAFAAGRIESGSPIAANAAWVAATIRDPESHEVQVVVFRIEYSGSTPALVTGYRVLNHKNNYTFRLQQQGRAIPNDSELATYLVTYAIRVARL